MEKFTNRARLACIASALVLTACAPLAVDELETVNVAGFTPGFVSGYLATDAVPSSLLQVPPPPGAGSAALALDENIAERSFALYNTPRWQLAISDADLSFPHAAGTFSCVLGIAVSPSETPRLYRLLRRSMTDLGASTGSAKKHYQRTRPFVLNNKPMCTPNDREGLEHDGSYPSGHNAIGWGWALILAEISPQQADALLVRGRSFGESRNVCNVHWHSDVMQGRLVGAGTVARLHADAAFRADLLAARDEIAAARAQGAKPTRDCANEAAALTITPSLAQ